MHVLQVVPSEVGGWDVVREEDGMAVSNHATRESAELAARIRAAEQGSDEDVRVNPQGIHAIDDESQGMRFALIALGVLLLVIVLVLVVLSLAGSLTGFGS
jgi:hypothetical protein